MENSIFHNTSEFVNFWKRRKMILKEKSLKSQLAYEGGWYEPHCSVGTAAFIEYVKNLKEYYDLHGSIYEIGCGPGAFLHVFETFGFEVGGLDINTEFLDFARECIKSSDLDLCEACDVPIEKKYNFILITNSINYFPSLDYVHLTLSKCVEKMNFGILLTEVNDIEYYDEYQKGLQLTLMAPVGGITDKNECEFYIKGKRISFAKKFFIDFAKKFNLSISFQKTNQFLQEVAVVNNFRFNVFLSKK